MATSLPSCAMFRSSAVTEQSKRGPTKHTRNGFLRKRQKVSSRYTAQIPNAVGIVRQLLSQFVQLSDVQLSGTSQLAQHAVRLENLAVELNNLDIWLREPI